MYFKLLRMSVLKNGSVTKILFKCNYDCHFTNRLQSRVYFRHLTKFSFQDINRNIQQQTYLSMNLSTLNNQTEVDFEHACNETLESLCEYFEEIIENSPQLENPDITFSDGVLTVQLGEPYGTYVINRQTPNKQIWLSSPTSGPKRYDFNSLKWIYKHDGVSLHELLTTELSKVVSVDVNFSKCLYSGTKKNV